MNLLLILTAASAWRVTTSDSFVSHEIRHPLGQFQDVDTAFANIERHFSLKLYKAAANAKEGFFFLSTVDLFRGLSTLYYGAEGECHVQLSDILNYPPHHALSESGMTNLAFRIEELANFNSLMTHAILHTDELDIENNFITEVDKFHTSQWRLEFGNGVDRDNAIIKWIDEFDLGLLDHIYTNREDPFSLISVTSLKPKLHLRQVNATTVDSLFHWNNEHSGMETFVSSISELTYGEFNYRRNSNGDLATARYIKLPWEIEEYGTFKTIIILPNDRDGIAELEQGMNKDTLEEIFTNENTALISVLLPQRLVIENVLDITEVLKNHMGLSELFEESHDFEKITKTRPIKLDQVISTVSMDYRMMTDTDPITTARVQVEKSFKADHPFIIMTVLEDEDPLILSMARFGWIPGVTNAAGPFRDDY